MPIRGFGSCSWLHCPDMPAWVELMSGSMQLHTISINPCAFQRQHLGHGHGQVPNDRGLFSDMADGCVIRPEQPDPETAELPGHRGPSETVPHHLCQVWADLPRRAWQRSHRRYFRAKIACANHVSPASLDACVLILEAAVANFFLKLFCLFKDSALALNQFRPDTTA